ncbi:MAG: chemotaxis protein CheX [Bryobacterales bacterium]|nr:chemotaxis protein CheX [Bryobacterales bacterium]
MVKPRGPEWHSGDERLTAAVHLSGDWNGAVLVECDQHQACRLASRFLSTDLPDTVDDVVRDVLGELANMIGGNMKCTLMQSIQLSMPSVVEGTNYRIRVCGAGTREMLAFDCAEGVFWVTVLSNR